MRIRKVIDRGRNTMPWRSDSAVREANSLWPSRTKADKIFWILVFHTVGL
jgi:hypothetical protein